MYFVFPNLQAVISISTVVLVAGLVGTGGMTLLMVLITRLRITNADMVRAIGSIFTGSLETAWPVGILLHFLSGMIFAVGYVLFFFLAPRSDVPALSLIGGVFGATHGLVVSAILANVIARHHPLKQFQKADFGVSIAHFVGHVVYGVLVGLVVGLLQGP